MVPTFGLTHLALAVHDPKRSGAEILNHGEFCPGEPYVFFRDPDGYQVEIRHENPAPIDPR